MRFCVPILLLAAGARANTALPDLLPGIDLLAVLDVLVDKTKCPFQCFIAAGNKITSCQDGIVKTFCKELVDLKAEAASCLVNCGADATTTKFMNLFFDKIACL